MESKILARAQSRTKELAFWTSLIFYASESQRNQNTCSCSKELAIWTSLIFYASLSHAACIAGLNDSPEKLEIRVRPLTRRQVANRPYKVMGSTLDARKPSRRPGQWIYTQVHGDLQRSANWFLLSSSDPFADLPCPLGRQRVAGWMSKASAAESIPEASTPETAEGNFWGLSCQSKNGDRTRRRW